MTIEIPEPISAREIQNIITKAISEARKDGERQWGKGLFYFDMYEVRSADKDGDYIDASMDYQIKQGKCPTQKEITEARDLWDDVHFVCTGYYWENYDHKFQRNGWENNPERSIPTDLHVCVNLHTGEVYY